MKSSSYHAKTPVFIGLFALLGGLGIAGDFNALSLKTYQRTPGKPVTVVESITNPGKNAEYQIIIYNGGQGGEYKRVSSAVIAVDGEQIFSPVDFNQKVETLTRKVALNQGSEISVELRGYPGGGLQMEVIGHDDGSATISQFTRVFPSPDSAAANLLLPPVVGVFEEDFGINMQQGDDDYDYYSTSFSFPFYGTNQNSLYLGSNGVVTFGRGDSDYTESISDHLSPEPRISGYFDDLYPGRSGEERQTYINEFENPSRVVITWNEVPEFSNTGANTFQITIFESGKIQLAYNGMSALDGIVGLSPGGSPPYQLVDLSAQTATLAVAGGTAVLEQFTSGSPFDMDNDFLIFEPNGSSGYDVTVIPGLVSPCVQ